MNALKSRNWIGAFYEHPNAGLTVLLGVERIVFRQRSNYQEIVIADAPMFGRALFLDGVVQFMQHDEFIYHEHVAILPLLFHATPHRVLILGGGDGLALRDVLRDSRVAHVTLVDIDAQVVDAAREHLIDLHRNSFDHPRASIVIDDARHFLAAPPQPFDVAIVDLVDPDGEEGMALYEETMRLLKDVLAPGALVSANAGTLAPPVRPALWVHTLMQRFFKHAVLHRAHVPSFNAEWGFALASDTIAFDQIDAAKLRDRIGRIEGEVRALVPELYPAAFRLPTYLQASTFEQEGEEATFGYIDMQDEES